MISSPMFWLSLFGLWLTCLAAIGARSLVEFSPHELKEICQRRKNTKRLGQVLRRHDRVALAAETLQVLATLLFLIAGAFWCLREAPIEGPLLTARVAVGAIALVAAEIWVPWSVVRIWADPFLYFTWPLWRAVGYLLAPLVLLARFVDAVMHRLAGHAPEEPDEESFEDDIRTMVTEGHREGLLEEDAREMIEGIIELGDLDVADVMTQRTDMVCLAKSLSWEEALLSVVKAGHTRVPVIDKNLDDIVGILYAKDLLPELAKPCGEPRRPWTALLREPYFVPETKPIDVLLEEFQQTRSHMAVVLDEYGGVCGLVTLEDVLEEIVGEIIDEYDHDLVDGIRRLDEGSFEALGKVGIDELNERLGLALPEQDDFDTIAGIVFTRLGHIPRAGEELSIDNVRITVIEASRRRIERVRIDVVDRAERETA